MTDPTPVTITGPVPIPVEVVAGVTAGTREHIQRQATDPSLPASTTFQQDLVAAGQRDINKTWEMTQSKVALSVVWASLAVSSTLAVFGKWLGSSDLQLASLVFVYGVANLVVGFYFGRTNHTKIGGVGANEAGR